jgi:putative MATE family efflux protein
MEGVGEVAFTGLGVCTPLILIISAFASLVSASGAPRASIFMGEGDNKSAERTMGSCFSLQCIVSVILSVIVFIFHRPMLIAFGANSSVIDYACDYMQIYSLGTIFVQLTLGMNAYITAQGFSTMSMVTIVIGAVVNIILDPIFIFALDMGVSGAALATIISQAISCVWVIAFLVGKKSLLRLNLNNMRIDYKLVLPCVALGVAPFVMQASESVISICFNSSLLKYGGDIAVGAMTILVSVMQFAMLPLMGIAQAAQPILSYNFGAKNAERVKKTFKLLLITCLIYSVALWSAVMLFPSVFSAMFTPSEELISYAAWALRIYFAGMIIFGIQTACQMTFVSLGEATSSVTVAVVRKFVLLLPLIYIIPAITENKVMGVFLAEPIADIIAVTFTAILFMFKFKKALSKIEAPKDKEVQNEAYRQDT